jgi:hypothetical protein
MTYPHDDTRCEQDSVDAAGFRDACRSAARLSDALGLSNTGHTIGEIVDTAVARLSDAPMPDAHDTETLAEVRLTDAEREALRRELDTREGSPRHRQMVAHIEALLAARIVQARAEVAGTSLTDVEREREGVRFPPSPGLWFREESVCGFLFTRQQARAGEGALRERVEALVDEWRETTASGHPDCAYDADCVGCAGDALRAALAETDRP